MLYVQNELFEAKIHILLLPPKIFFLAQRKFPIWVWLIIHIKIRHSVLLLVSIRHANFSKIVEELTIFLCFAIKSVYLCMISICHKYTTSINLLSKFNTYLIFTCKYVYVCIFMQNNLCFKIIFLTFYVQYDAKHMNGENFRNLFV